MEFNQKVKHPELKYVLVQIDNLCQSKSSILQRTSLESVGAKDQFAASRRKLRPGRLSNNELGDW